MDYRVKEDSIDEDSVSSPKRIELSENTVDQENEENIDPKSTEGQGFDEGGFKEPVVETISPGKQTEFPSVKNQNDNLPVKASPRKINEERVKAVVHLSPSGILKIHT